MKKRLTQNERAIAQLEAKKADLLRWQAAQLADFERRQADDLNALYRRQTNDVRVLDLAIARLKAQAKPKTPRAVKTQAQDAT